MIAGYFRITSPDLFLPRNTVIHTSHLFLYISLHITAMETGDAIKIKIMIKIVTTDDEKQSKGLTLH